MKKGLLVVFASLLLFNVYGETYTATQDLNVRKASSVNSEIIGHISKNAIIDVISIEGNWGKIQYESQEGYVSTKFLEKGGEDRASEKTYNETSSSSSNSDGWGAWIVMFFIFATPILLIVFRKTAVARFIFSATGFIFKSAVKSAFKPSSGSTTNSSSNRTSPSSANTQSFMRNYRCRHCGTKVKVARGEYPSANYQCKKNAHEWIQFH